LRHGLDQGHVVVVTSHGDEHGWVGRHERFGKTHKVIRIVRINKGEQHGKAITFCLLLRASDDFGRKCPAVTFDDRHTSRLHPMPEQAGKESGEIATGRGRKMHRPAEALAHDGI
jgi:hypothetical protein